MELAKSWFRNGIAQPPEELLTLLSSSSHTHGARFITGIPELVTSLHERGEGRNHDLALVGCTEKETFTLCVEAKADEQFGNHTVRQYWNRSIARREKGTPTRVPERILSLLTLVNLLKIQNGKTFAINC